MTPRGLSWLATAVLVAAILYLLLWHLLFASSPGFVAAQIGAALLMLWARGTFGRRSFHAGANPTEGGLVTTGPYRLIRHPIYAAILLFLWAGVASHPSLVTLVAVGCASGAIAVRIAAEERLVSVRYPEYADYAAKTKRVIPFVL